MREGMCAGAVPHVLPCPRVWKSRATSAPPPTAMVPLSRPPGNVHLPALCLQGRQVRRPLHAEPKTFTLARPAGSESGSRRSDGVACVVEGVRRMFVVRTPICPQ